MTPTNRQKMISGAADLIRRRGLNSTSLRDVVNYTATPRGSLQFYFPGGKLELLEEVIAYADQEIVTHLTKAMVNSGPVLGLRSFIDGWKAILESTQFEAGCTLLSVAIEPYTDDGKSSASTHNLNAAADRLLERVNQAFRGWEGILSEALQKAGVAQDRAHRLAVLCVAAIEGTVALCRAAKNAESLDLTRIELELLLESAISDCTMPRAR